MGAILGQVAIVLLVTVLLAVGVLIGHKLLLLLGNLLACQRDKDLCSEYNAYVRPMVLVDGFEAEWHFGGCKLANCLLFF